MTPRAGTLWNEGDLHSLLAESAKADRCCPRTPPRHLGHTPKDARAHIRICAHAHACTHTH